MTVISNIDEHGINKNLRVRYVGDSIYVSAKVVHCRRKRSFEKKLQ